MSFIDDLSGISGRENIAQQLISSKGITSQTSKTIDLNSNDTVSILQPTTVGSRYPTNNNNNSVPSITQAPSQDEWAWETGASWLSASSCDSSGLYRWYGCYDWDLVYHPSSLFSTWTITTTTSLGQYTDAKCSGPFTTLADGVARALCSADSPRTTTVGWEITTITYSSVTATQSAPPCSETPLDCTVPAYDCSKMWSAQFTEDTSIFLGQKTRTEEEVGVISYRPRCTEFEIDSCWAFCTFSVSAVNLLYWPTTNIARVTITTDNQVYTAHWGTHTVTSPTVYVVFPTMSNIHGCGQVHTDKLVPLDPKHIMTDSLTWIPGKKWPVINRSTLNFADLAFSTVGDSSYPLVPVSLYRDTDRCRDLNISCETIYHDHQPVISFTIEPSVFKSIDPAWSHCGWEDHVQVDPAGVLHPTVSIAIPTLDTTYDERPNVLHPASAISAPTLKTIAPEPARVFENKISPAATPMNPSPQRTTTPGHLYADSVVHNLRPDPVTFWATPTLVATPAQSGMPALPQLNLNPPNVPHQFDEAHQQNHPVQGSPGNQDEPLLIKANQGQANLVTRVVFTAGNAANTAVEIAPGTYSIGGHILSKGGSPVFMNGAQISAFDEGIVVQDPPISQSSPIESFTEEDKLRDSDIKKVSGVFGSPRSKSTAPREAVSIYAVISALLLNFGSDICIYTSAFKG
ncbi:hypothetical protein EJ08DRAFT_658407 [Tothia fuscella]|uniref:Uncharacterized protein n=1 Tax=Tothia fuscella TaxID=1048955 RepID=A0A9P4NXE5_9PEZI|nr:hypothetical protein EJ08DRAFT_658407 [Tothia fuscella]